MLSVGFTCMYHSVELSTEDEKNNYGQLLLENVACIYLDAGVFYSTP